MTAKNISTVVEALLSAYPAAPIEAPRERRLARVLSHVHEGSRYIRLVVEPPRDFALGHQRPAQYVTLKTQDTQARFFVLAQAPTDPHWEFLIEDVDEVRPFFDALFAGQELFVSPPEGGGFVPEFAHAAQAHLFATGSGIATMRPLIRQWLAQPDLAPASIALYYGEHQDGDFAYTDELSHWRAQGIVVYQTLGRGPAPNFPYQFVQHAFDASDPSIDDAVVYLAGAPIMIEVVADKLLRLGLAPERLLLNI